MTTLLLVATWVFGVACVLWFFHAAAKVSGDPDESRRP